MPLDQDETDFFGELDHPLAELCGRGPFGIVISKADQERDPSPMAIGILDGIVDKLADIVAATERALVQQTGKPLEQLPAMIGQPVIWIDSQGDIHDLAQHEWTLLVPRGGANADAAWHLEFTGDELQEIWEGEGV